ncbi:NYN domain-containing protein [Corynebacterium sp. ES2794-CONJ1]|nr:MULTISPECIES: NYN domain-containing protein [unclassified Corynebacterium]MCS4490504.1 NYN domain-containing protein [Corynebacterium sp. ES2775-CONJ]MCS4492284.1 NYN domain-containing protein [Corynebacterium sp. ES2715-CONJ3]MCS4532232.1 NYN domain-containing protein [Corynebacterium sp. ES2730-CONJ]MCU9519803.1 NYN domain-containing protein [Corynebacterium sp. ES2794-CONJ1]
MLERTQIYVDTSYLLASFYNAWETGARSQLEIDLPEVVRVLSSMVEQSLGQPVHRQLWYDGIPDTGPHRYQRSLRTCAGVQLRAGSLIEWGERRTQKAVDTRLVADMVLAGVRREVTDMVLVSGDADMIPGVQEAVDNGIRVHLYGFGWESMSSALRFSCDTTTILDPRMDFEDCMQLQVLEGPLPPRIQQEESKDSADHPEYKENFDPDAADNFQQPYEYQSAENSEELQEDHQPEKQNEVIVENEAEIVAQVPDTEVPPPHHVAVESIKVERNSVEEIKDGVRSVSIEENVEYSAAVNTGDSSPSPTDAPAKRPVPSPSMMAPRRKLRSRYVPLPNEVWTSSGSCSPFDVGQQYAIWWYEKAASPEQLDDAHTLTGGGLPPEIDRPLLQFACETLHEYTLTESQRVNLRDGFHSGMRGILLGNRPD